MRWWIVKEGGRSARVAVRAVVDFEHFLSVVLGKRAVRWVDGILTAKEMVPQGFYAVRESDYPSLEPVNTLRNRLAVTDWVTAVGETEQLVGQVAELDEAESQKIGFADRYKEVPLPVADADKTGLVLLMRIQVSQREETRRGK